MPWLIGIDDWLASYRTTEKIEWQWYGGNWALVSTSGFSVIR